MQEAPNDAIPRPALGAVLAGVILVALYTRYAATHPLLVVFHAGPYSSLSHIAAGELKFWMAHAMLLVPGALLIGWGLAESIARRTHAALDSLLATERRFHLAAVAFVIALLLLYALLRELVMLDMPITDDETSLRFGSLVWLEGKLMVPRLEPEGAYVNLFAYSRDGLITSFDWPGGIAFQALAIASGLDHVAYALVAALGGLATAATASRWLGRKAGVLAAVIWFVSPMGLTLSLTEHAHVVSRTCIAVAFYFLSRLGHPGDGARPLLNGVGLGVAVGLGLCVRPFETGFLMAPTAVWLVVAAVRARPGARQALAGAVAGVVPFIGAHAAYNWLVTGNPLLPPRFDRANNNANALLSRGPVHRLGSHLAHNAMLLAIFSLGPLGAAAAAVAPTFRQTTRIPAALLLGLGLVSFLLLTLAHDNIGIHSVGPIHYSEALVPLVLLFTFFVHAIGRRIRQRVWRHRAQAMIAVYLVLGLGFFSWKQVRALELQAWITRLPLAALEANDVHDAVVLAPLRAHLYRPGTPGSWVLQFPMPDPSGRGDIVFVRQETDLDLLRRTFPDREIWRMRFFHADQPVHLERLHPGEGR